MVASVFEMGLSPKERVRLVEWLKKFNNSFLAKVKEESEWEAYSAFFRQLAADVYTNQVAFSKDFVKIYREAADDFTDTCGGQYDEATHWIMYASMVEVVRHLAKDKIIPWWFADEVVHLDALKRSSEIVENLIRNN